MNIKVRLRKLESTRRTDRNVVIKAVNDKESDGQVYQRCFVHSNKPKVVIYASKMDVLL